MVLLLPKCKSNLKSQSLHSQVAMKNLQGGSWSHK